MLLMLLLFVKVVGVGVRLPVLFLLGVLFLPLRWLSFLPLFLLCVVVCYRCSSSFVSLFLFAREAWAYSSSIVRRVVLNWSVVGPASSLGSC